MPPSPLKIALEDLAPDGVAACFWTGEGTPALYPQEAAAIEGAVTKRRVEFARGRACARAALSDLGIPPGAIPIGKSRAPVWPDGHLGSITHCEGSVAAIAASTSAFYGLGIDVEPAKPLPRDTRALILRAAEHDDVDASVRETVTFSAKESIFKAIFPATGVWLDFLDVELGLDPEVGSFTATPASTVAETTPGLADLHGRYALVNGFILTLAWIRV